jgi:hypothetical protein
MWAAERGREITGYSRTEFASFKFGEEMMRRQNSPPPPTPSREELKKLSQKMKGMDLTEIWQPYLRRPKAAICPVFVEGNAGPKQVGCGVLLKIDDARFLLTAAHVTDERKTNTLLVPAKEGFVNLYGLFLETPLPPTGRRLDDSHDVAVVRLDENLTARLHEDLVFLEHGDCELADTTTAGDVYTIIGYPARKSGTDGHSVFTEQFSLSGEGVTDARLQQLKLDPKRHLVVQYRFKRAVNYSTMRKGQLPHPEGMSGCGIFAWDKRLPELSALSQPKLVGILTEYHQSKNVFVGTRLSSHIMAIHKSDPSLPIAQIRRTPLTGSIAQYF